MHMVGKDTGTDLVVIGMGELFDQVMAVEDVVTQHQGTGVLADKLAPDDEGLRQAIGAGLYGVFNVHAPLAAITEQVGEAWCVYAGWR
jgi:hypothetical protein